MSLVIDGNVGAIVELKCETDFVAGSDQFKAEADALAKLVAADGVDAVADRKAELEELQVTLKENIGLGDVSGSRPPTGTISAATSTCRAAAASTACSSTSPAGPRNWLTTSRCTSRSPGRST